MVIFSINGEDLKKGHQIDFKLEKAIPKITKKKYHQLFGLNFVKIINLKRNNGGNQNET